MSDKTINSPPEDERTQKGRARGRLHQKMHAHPALALTTKAVVTAVGLLVIGAGALMLVTPGPGIVAIVIGLAILATEWEWADRWLVKAKAKAQEARHKAGQMDHRVRRRRVAMTALSCVVVAGIVVGYVAAYDWPSPAVDGWDWVQSVAGWMPELPGM